MTQGGHISTEPRINERIRVPEVRLVGPAGEQVGIVAINDALRLAQEADLDLVEVAPMARPPVAKLMDYGKFKYESALKARESRKNQAQTVIKEIKLRPKIDPHDYGTKKGHVERFLKQGDKVKVTIMFRGREQSRPELGFKLLQRLAGDIEELGFVESSPKQDGRNMIMVIGPHKRKTDAMAAAKADRERASAERASRSSARVAEQAAPGGLATEQPETEQPETEQAVTEQAVTEQPAPDAQAATEPETEQAAAEQATPAQATEQATPAAKPATEAAARRATEAAARPAAPKPTAPRPTPASARPAAPKPSAPRATPGSAGRPGPSAGAAPKPTAPRGTTAAPRPAAASSAAPKPGPARRPGDGPVPSSRSVAADRGAAAKESGEADS
ncbi:MAG TPA: translation initiation factor IF-3 [Streptosporangiaceae bacterium]|nr:translation initiation factor IF-3 [Streptosporangiaceae bacterium]